MPETLDFEQIAKRVARSVPGIIDPAIDTLQTDIARELRLVWNARGAADRLIVVTEATSHTPGLSPYVLDVQGAIRRLDITPQRSADNAAASGPSAST